MEHSVNIPGKGPVIIKSVREECSPKASPSRHDHFHESTYIHGHVPKFDEAKFDRWRHRGVGVAIPESTRPQKARTIKLTSSKIFLKTVNPF